ncbi:MAG: 16S rRNA (guanine(527)-N(7))-methyltransferase RsmG [Bacteroidales bacterium]|nr:16S rRNA (guanine(527)-N(7))-methyltransferase RsmG [Bacteroidales bacterium]
MDNPINKYFNTLPGTTKDKLQQLEVLYSNWNNKINLVSRKDMDYFPLHHVIHSLSILKIIQFVPGTRILDAGTGGGLPGIPLAAVFPECFFTLADSVRKKIAAVSDISEKLGLYNVKAVWTRVEDLEDKYDFIVTRAVAPFPKIVKWTTKLVNKLSVNKLPNGIIALKGGQLSEELEDFPECRIYNLRDFFDEEYFREKKIVYMAV